MPATIVEDVVSAFERCGLIDRANVVSRWHCRLVHGNPTPWLSNQDHSLMQGVEADGTAERTINGDMSNELISKA